jgi:hypothetical protein
MLGALDMHFKAKDPAKKSVHCAEEKCAKLAKPESWVCLFLPADLSRMTGPTASPKEKTHAKTLTHREAKKGIRALLV